MPKGSEFSGRWGPSWLWTLIGWGWALPWTLFLASVAILVSWLPPRGNWTFWVARIWARGLLLFSGMRWTARHESDERQGGPYVFMANHQSILDIPLLLASLPVQTRFMAKSSLFKIPIFGWSLSAGGFIPVDRSTPQRSRRAFEVAVRRLRNGASVLVFPEQTRSRDGRILPFKRGGFLLAKRGGVEIVPIGLRGTGVAVPRGTIKVRPQGLEAHYGRALSVTGGAREQAEGVGVVRETIARLGATDLAEGAQEV